MRSSNAALIPARISQSSLPRLTYLPLNCSAVIMLRIVDTTRACYTGCARYVKYDPWTATFFLIPRSNTMQTKLPFLFFFFFFYFMYMHMRVCVIVCASQSLISHFFMPERVACP